MNGSIKLALKSKFDWNSWALVPSFLPTIALAASKVL